MSYDFEPSSRYPPLSKDRLSGIARIIRDVRSSAVLLHDPSIGDNEWSLGCRIYARTCHAIREAAQNCDWLTVLPDARPLRFTFVIGSIPFKFYRGDANDPPDHYLIVSYAELHQQQMAFELDGVRLLDQVLRLAVEVDAKTREVSHVTLVEMDQVGNLTGTYSIPFDVPIADSVIPTGNVARLQREGVELPPPPFQPLNKQEEKEKSEEDKRNAGSQ
jgi:hypothetical protein